MSLLCSSTQDVYIFSITVQYSNGLKSINAPELFLTLELLGAGGETGFFRGAVCSGGTGLLQVALLRGSY